MALRGRSHGVNPDEDGAQMSHSFPDAIGAPDVIPNCTLKSVWYVSCLILIIGTSEIAKLNYHKESFL